MEEKKKEPLKEPQEPGRDFPEKKHPTGTAVEERPEIRGEEKEERRWKEEPWKKEGMKKEEEKEEGEEEKEEGKEKKF